MKTIALVSLLGLAACGGAPPETNDYIIENMAPDASPVVPGMTQGTPIENDASPDAAPQDRTADAAPQVDAIAPDAGMVEPDAAPIENDAGTDSATPENDAAVDSAPAPINITCSGNANGLPVSQWWFHVTQDSTGTLTACFEANWCNSENCAPGAVAGETPQCNTVSSITDPVVYLVFNTTGDYMDVSYFPTLGAIELINTTPGHPNYIYPCAQ